MKNPIVRCFLATCQKRILIHEIRVLHAGQIFCCNSCANRWDTESANQVILTRRQFQAEHPAPKTVSQAFELLARWHTPVHGAD
jgi:hypothetical protein